MKKIFIVLFLFSVAKMYSQEQFPFRKNEVTLNASSLLYKGVEVSYERAFTEEFSAGVSTLFLGYGEQTHEQVNLHFSPYARYYFGKKPVGGFFVEGFVSLFNKSYRTDAPIGYWKEMPFERVTSVALGFGLGVKWQTRSGFTFEVCVGVGREPRSVDEGYFPLMSKSGLRFGYKF